MPLPGHAHHLLISMKKNMIRHTLVLQMIYLLPKCQICIFYVITGVSSAIDPERGSELTCHGVHRCQEKPVKEDIIIMGMHGPWEEEKCGSFDHYTTKIGGLPNWPMATKEINRDLLKCGVCGGPWACFTGLCSSID
jgi:hypothetical protein